MAAQTFVPSSRGSHTFDLLGIHFRDLQYSLDMQLSDMSALLNMSGIAVLVARGGLERRFFISYSYVGGEQTRPAHQSVYRRV